MFSGWLPTSWHVEWWRFWSVCSVSLSWNMKPSAWCFRCFQLIWQIKQFKNFMTIQLTLRDHDILASQVWFDRIQHTYTTRLFLHRTYWFGKCLTRKNYTRSLSPLALCFCLCSEYETFNSIMLNYVARPRDDNGRPQSDDNEFKVEFVQASSHDFRLCFLNHHHLARFCDVEINFLWHNFHTSERFLNWMFKLLRWLLSRAFTASTYSFQYMYEFTYLVWLVRSTCGL